MCVNVERLFGSSFQNPELSYSQWSGDGGQKVIIAKNLPIYIYINGNEIIPKIHNLDLVKIYIVEELGNILSLKP